MSLYNLRNPAVKRLMKEAEELLHPTDEYHAQPLEDNLFEWHFTLRGPPNTDYEGGIYHGRITLPPDYPMKPPSIILLTPNGRFETNKKICLSISGHHPESWQPSWSIRTALLAIIGFMPTHGNGALGSLDYTPEERQQLAIKSQEFQCLECGYIKDIFLKKSSECQKEATPQESLSELELQDKSQDYSFISELNNHHSEPWWTPALSAKRKCVRDLRKKYQHIYDNEELRTFWKLKYKKEAAKYKKAILDAKSNQSQSTDTLFCGSDTNICSEKCVSKQAHSKDDGTTLVHRHKSSQSPAVNVETKLTTCETRHSLLYSVFIFVIVAIILFLCLRRIFSM